MKKGRRPGFQGSREFPDTMPSDYTQLTDDSAESDLARIDAKIKRNKKQTQILLLVLGCLFALCGVVAICLGSE